MSDFYPIQTNDKFIVTGIQVATTNVVWCAACDSLADAEQVILDLAANDAPEYAYLFITKAEAFYKVQSNPANVK